MTGNHGFQVRRAVEAAFATRLSIVGGERRRDRRLPRIRGDALVLPARHLEPALEEQPRQRRAIGRRSCRRRAGAQRRPAIGAARDDAHRRASAVDAARRPAAIEQAVDDDVGRLDAHVPDAHGLSGSCAPADANSHFTARG